MFDADCTFPCLGAVAGISGEIRLVAMVANIALGQSWEEAHDSSPMNFHYKNPASKNFIPAENTIKSILLWLLSVTIAQLQVIKYLIYPAICVNKAQLLIKEQRCARSATSQDDQEFPRTSSKSNSKNISKQTHIHSTGPAAMRLRTVIPAVSAVLLTTHSTSASLLRASPFSAAYLDTSNPDSLHSLLKRQSCPADYTSCAGVSAPNSASNCCAVSSTCALDNAGNIACCPLGSFCTGIISSTPSPTTAHTGPITDAPTQTAAPATGYVPNTFYPFPILFSSGADLGDKAQCEAAYESCAGYYEQCTQRLAGGGGEFAVTVAGPGGGITVAPGVGVSVGIESATSICSSLSGEACPGTMATCTGAAEKVTGKETGAATTTPTQTGFFIVDPGTGGAAEVEAGRWGVGMVVIVGLITGWGL